MITRAAIYKRTLTRPAMYTVTARIAIVTIEAADLNAVCIVPFTLIKRSLVNMDLTATCPVPSPVNTRAEVTPSINVQCETAQHLTATCEVRTGLNAKTKVIK